MYFFSLCFSLPHIHCHVSSLPSLTRLNIPNSFKPSSQAVFSSCRLLSSRLSPVHSQISWKAEVDSKFSHPDNSPWSEKWFCSAPVKHFSKILVLNEAYSCYRSTDISKSITYKFLLVIVIPAFHPLTIHTFHFALFITSVLNSQCQNIPDLTVWWI